MAPAPSMANLVRAKPWKFSVKIPTKVTTRITPDNSISLVSSR